ncbi:MAG: DNA damage-inducible protein 1 [Trizodia sp. TS-e1964]|nr:MAG: DNA damage-inducible protein 1 [Trizodia sp. TS-e1964]
MFAAPFTRLGLAATLARITVSVSSASSASSPDLEILSLELSEATTTAELKELIKGETKILPALQFIYHNGRLLDDNAKTLQELSVLDGDMLAMHVANPGEARNTQEQTSRPQAAPSHRNREEPVDAETVRLQILGSPEVLESMRHRNPDLINTIQNPESFREVYNRQSQMMEQAQREQRQEIARLHADPFDVESQTKIAEMIRKEVVRENLQNAYEHHPEAFGKVTMLYIDAEVNGHKIKTFVDSGAQATIMSPSCAVKCGIMHLVDERYAGIAHGVGTARIIGRVHLAQIKVGKHFLPCSFTVMEGKEVDLLFGLDMLKRYQASIDLKKNSLLIQGEEVPFLSESDIPTYKEEQDAQEPTVDGPGGTKIGAKTGAVTAPNSSAPAKGSSQGQQYPFGSFEIPPRNFPTLRDPRAEKLPAPVIKSTPAGEGFQQSQPGQSQPPQPAQSQPPQPAQSQPPQTSQQQSAPLQTNFPAQSITQLEQLGFSRENVIRALTAADGNVDYAAGYLFGNG